MEGFSNATAPSIILPEEETIKRQAYQITHLKRALELHDIPLDVVSDPR